MCRLAAFMGWLAVGARKVRGLRGVSDHMQLAVAIQASVYELLSAPVDHIWSGVVVYICLHQRAKSQSTYIGSSLQSVCSVTRYLPHAHYSKEAIREKVLYPS